MKNLRVETARLAFARILNEERRLIEFATSGYGTIAADRLALARQRVATYALYVQHQPDN